MENLAKPVPAKEYSPLTLAFMGDSVYELLVRNYLVSEGNCPVRSLNKRKVELVRCQSQAKALTFMWPALSEQEKEIAMRGRNAHVGHVPKNASIGDYHAATALESLFGYLFLTDQSVRLGQLFVLAMESGRQEGDESFAVSHLPQ